MARWLVAGAIFVFATSLIAGFYGMVNASHVPVLLYPPVLGAAVAWLLSGVMVRPRRVAAEAGGAPPGEADEPPTYQPASADAYAVLGVEPSISDEELARVYHARVASCHPDRLENVDPEVRNFAEEKLRRINQAYADVRRARASAGRREGGACA